MFTLKLVDHYRKEKTFETFTENLTAYAKGSKYFSEHLAEANLKEDCHHVVIQWGNQAMALNNAQVAFLYSDGLDIEEFKPDTLNNALTPEMCEAQNVHERLKEKLATWDSASLTDNGEIRLTSSGRRGKDLSDDETELLRKRLQATQQDDKPRAQGRPDTFATPYGAVTEREFKFPTGLCNARAIQSRITTIRDRLKECDAVPDDLDSVKLDALLCHVGSQANIIIGAVNTHDPFDGRTQGDFLKLHDTLLSQLVELDRFIFNTREIAKELYPELFAGLGHRFIEVVPSLITLAERMVTVNKAAKQPDTAKTPYGWVDVPEFKIPTGLNNARAIRDTMKGLHLKLTAQPHINKPSDVTDTVILETHINSIAKTAFDLVRMVESISPVSGMNSEKLCAKADQLSDELDAFQCFYDNTRAGSEAFYNELFAGLARHPNDVIPNLITLAEGMITTNRANKPK